MKWLCLIGGAALRRLAGVVALLLALGAPAPVWAQGPSDEELKRHYDEGIKAYNIGAFPRAIDEFKRAYEIKADPILLFNIAQAHRLAGEPDKALFFYRSYLRAKPDAINRKAVEERIAALEKQVPDRSAAPVTPLAPPATTPPALPSAPNDAESSAPQSAVGPTPGDEPPPYRRWYFWAAIGTGLLLVGLLASSGGSQAPQTDFPIQRFP